MKSYKGLLVGVILGMITLLAMGQIAGPFDDWQFTNIDINSGAIDGTPIGAATPSTGAFTTMSVNSGEIDSSEMDETLIKYLSTDLTNANIKALNATPIELIAAPGADKFIEVISAKLILDYGSEVFTESADNLILAYDDGTTQVGDTIEATGFIDQSADTVTNWIGVKDGIVSAALSVNKNVSISNSGDGEYAGNASADSTMTIKIIYRTHTAGL
jgi:hypothetical protein